MPVKIEIEYEGNLHCKAVHGPSGAVLRTDAPTDHAGKGESFSPTDLCATALGTCYLTVMGISAKKDGVNIDGTRAHVEKYMSTEKPRRIMKVIVDIDMAKGIPLDYRGKLEHVARNCPTAKSINPEMDVDLRFRYPD